MRAAKKKSCPLPDLYVVLLKHLHFSYVSCRLTTLLGQRCRVFCLKSALGRQSQIYVHIPCSSRPLVITVPLHCLEYYSMLGGSDDVEFAIANPSNHPRHFRDPVAGRPALGFAPHIVSLVLEPGISSNGAFPQACPHKHPNRQRA
jgi:hypothetical protein